MRFPSGSRWTADGVGRRRQATGFLLAALLVPLLTALLAAERQHLSLADDLLIYLVATLGVTIVGGVWPAIATALAAGLCLNYYFTPPLHTWTVDAAQNITALLLFVLAAVAVSGVVHVAARNAAQSDRAAAEARELVDLAQTVVRDDDADAVLAQLRLTWGVRAELEERGPAGWTRVAGAPLTGTADVVDIRPGLRLRASTRDPSVSSRLVEGVAAQAAAALDRSRSRAQAAEVKALAETDRMRAALLAAVGHDLRTPLAAVKAGVSSLRQDDVDWSPQDRDELLQTVEEGADRLEQIINNLLDMTRVQTGTVAPVVRALSLDEVLPLALVGLDEDRLDVDVPDGLPLLLADPGLLERVLANVVTNALQYSPQDRRVHVRARVERGQAVVDVIDHGSGVPETEQHEIFAPFRQLGDSRSRSGVGLGLAVARGFAEVMNGDIAASTTEGGGLTMRLRLPLAAVPV